ncbi:NUDIX hydrolase [Candidatus Bathyarchaeota archaeon]|nr:NUDIX hydrolase [Candidatus Bathyarchaeota archaeon]
MEKTVSSKIIHKGKNFDFLLDQVELPNKKYVNREIVDHPGAVAILPVTNDGKIVLINQYRYVTKKRILEIPAGTIEKGELIEKCAVRELKEETGYSTNHIIKMLSCYLAPGYSNEILHVFLAKELEKGEQKLEDDETISVQEYGYEEILTKIEDGSIIDAKTILSILFYLTRNNI